MTTLRSTQATGSGQAINTKRLILAGLVAAIAASMANLLVYYLMPALFNFTLEFPLQGPGSDIQRLPAYMVISVTFIASIGAVFVQAVLNRFTARPVTIFRVIALVILLLSFGAPFSLPAPVSVKLTLASMHVITAATITYALTTLGRKE